MGTNEQQSSSPKRGFRKPTALEALAAAAILLFGCVICTVSWWLPALASRGLWAGLIMMLTTAVIAIPVVLYVLSHMGVSVTGSRAVFVVAFTMVWGAAYVLSNQDPRVLLILPVVSVGLFVWRLGSNPILPFQLTPAVQHLQKGDKLRALQVVNNYIRSNPAHAMAYQLRAVIELSMMNVGDAERDARKALQLAPKIDACHATLANAYLAQGRYAEAKSGFAEAVRLKSSAINHHNFGLACFRLEEYDLAAESFRTAIRKGIAPVQSALLATYFLGRCMEISGRVDEAEKVYQSMNKHRRGYHLLASEITTLPDHPSTILLRADLEDIARRLNIEP